MPTLQDWMTRFLSTLTLNFSSAFLLLVIDLSTCVLSVHVPLGVVFFFLYMYMYRHAFINYEWCFVDCSMCEYIHVAIFCGLTPRLNHNILN